MKVTIDERERERGMVVQAALKGMGFEADIRTIAVGDYILGNKVGIEYKTPSDFVASIVDRRIFDQAKELQDNYIVPMIIVSAPISVCIASAPNMTRESIIGTVTSLVYRYGVNVLFLDPGVALIDILRSLIRKTEKGGSVSYTPLRKSAKTSDHQAAIIAALPGVGMKRAGTILEKYRTVSNALRQVDDWVTVDGIGPKTVERARSVITDEYSTD